MLINVYGGKDNTVRITADLVGVQLVFRGKDTYRVTVYTSGYKVGETRERRSFREWVNWFRSLR